MNVIFRFKFDDTNRVEARYFAKHEDWAFPVMPHPGMAIIPPGLSSGHEAARVIYEMNGKSGVIVEFEAPKPADGEQPDKVADELRQLGYVEEFRRR
jgi:hypothetical protein